MSDLRPALFLGPDPVAALASQLDCLCGESCGVRPGRTAALSAFPGAASSAELLELAQVQEEVRRRAGQLLVWKSSARIEARVAALGVPLANSPARAARRLENKAHFSQAAAAAGLPVPPAVFGSAGPELAAAVQGWAGPWVFQLAHGFSGQHTYPAASAAELEELNRHFQGRLSRISQFISGVPVTVTGVASAGSAQIGNPCVQLTGMAELTPFPLGSCGNDFDAPVPAEEAVRAVAQRTGEWLASQGHRGVFGVDLVAQDDGSCWCLEVNPRLVASVPLWSLSSQEQPAEGLLGKHLRCFQEPAPEPGAELRCDWSQVILYQLRDRPQRWGQSVVGGLSPEGRFEETGPLTLDGPAPGEIAIVIRRPSGAGRELARIVFQGPALAGGALVPWLAGCVDELRSRLDGDAATTVSPMPLRR